MSTVMNQRVKVEKTLTINKAVEELYRFWRNFDNLPRFIKHLKQVRVYDEKRESSGHATRTHPLRRSVTEAAAKGKRPL